MSDHFQWKVMHFGFKNAPAIFQRVIYTLLRKNDLDSFTLNYIDNILIYSKTFESHFFHIEKVLTALHKHNVKLKREKCHFAQKEVNYLGHTISFNHFKPLTSNTIAIDEFPKPLKLKNVQQFIGKVNYYRKFVLNNI